MAGIPEAEIGQLVDEWAKHLQANGQRLTTPRREILRAALRLEGAFTAEELLVEARKADRLISLATVYRTLPILVKGGVLRQAELPGDKQYYENGQAGKTRIQLVCSDCGEVIPMEDACLTLRQGFLARRMGFTAEQISTRIEATCEKVRREGACQGKNGSR